MNPCAWTLRDLERVPKTGLRVASTFACGGGSSMGYKLAGYDVVLANDIDPEMAWHYQENLHPAHFVLGPVKSLTTLALPKETEDLDILDGSPPCSAFSSSGLREKAWGKVKKFREGQAGQVLDDLFFDFLDVAERLRPKVILAENVKGIIQGNAQGYVRLIATRLRALGYRAQIFCVDAAACGVPQQRERVFFCACREDVFRRALVFVPSCRMISTSEACADVQDLTQEERLDTRATSTDLAWWHKTWPGRSYCTAIEREGLKKKFWNNVRTHAGKPAPTLSSQSGQIMHWAECRKLSNREYRRLGSFPEDYVARTPVIEKYIIGMSVPPRMMAALASAVRDQWLAP